MRIPIQDDFGGNNYNVSYDIVEEPSKISDGKKKGKIRVEARMGSESGGLIASAKVNLYMLNGISPKLVASKFTDQNGVAIFDNLENGSYRVIAIADKKYFEKPIYKKWNEVTIDNSNKEDNVLIIYRVRKNIGK